ncbi:MAG: hypothetical protein ACOX5G_03015 [Kiritimatiellia bacterium]|jgi:hypothetical protein
MKRIVSALSFALLFALANAMAQKPPEPIEVANSVSNLWMAQDFSGMSTYVSNLYNTCSNYVPAILAASFHDGVYLGKLSQAFDKLARVRGCVTNNPQSFTVEFRDLLGELQSETKREIDLHARMGTSPQALESNASPQTVRSLWGTELLPEINILYYAPATNVP